MIESDQEVIHSEEVIGSESDHTSDPDYIPETEAGLIPETDAELESQQKPSEFLTKVLHSLELYLLSPDSSAKADPSTVKNVVNALKDILMTLGITDNLLPSTCKDTIHEKFSGESRKSNKKNQPEMNSSMATYTNHLIQVFQFIQAEEKYTEYGVEIGKVISVKEQLSKAFINYKKGTKLDNQFQKEEEG